MSILIKNILHENKIADILIKENKIEKIAESINEKTDTIIDGSDKAALPGLVNGHTHAAMSLLRGYGDDMALKEWLETKIWPIEAKMTEDDIYWGVKLACLEMIKTGTTCFNDMYWHFSAMAKATDDMGLRAVLAETFIDIAGEKQAQESKEKTEKAFNESSNFSDRIKFAIAPHAIYTVSKKSLEWLKNFAKTHSRNSQSTNERLNTPQPPSNPSLASDRSRGDLMIHIHVSETEKEVEDSIKNYGKRPFEYLEEIGFLKSSNIIAAHAIWLDDAELEICKRRDVNIVYNPISNLKLASGINFRYKEIKNLGINILLGTDGTASNNNLDIFEEMKFASLLQKSINNDPTCIGAEDAINLAAFNGAKAFNLPIGEIKEGALADIILIDLKRAELTPLHSLYSCLVYSANGSCVDTAICDGKILMLGGYVEGEEEIMAKAGEATEKLVRKI